MKNRGEMTMKKFEVVYVETVEADDFFDAVDKLKNDEREILSVSEAPDDLDGDRLVFNGNDY